MEKCLHSKFEGVVNNDNLPYLNGLTVQVKEAINTTIYTMVKTPLDSGKQITFKGNGQSFTTERADRGNVNRVELFESLAPYKLTLFNKHDLIFLNISNKVSVNVKDVVTCENLETLVTSTNGLLGNLSDLIILENLVRLEATIGGLNGRIEDFVEGYIHLFPSKVKDLEMIMSYIATVTFNGNTNSVYCIAFNASTATVYSNFEKTTVIGSYNGTTWTYNS